MIITFISDFGHADDSAGCCRGVMLGRAPSAIIIDITHNLPPFDLRRAALSWRNVLPYMPSGVHLGIVDPGVGTERRPVAVHTQRGDFLVGPDNGLVRAGADALGGAVSVVELANPRYRLEPVSSTFHGRDIFAPATAALAMGVELDDLGPSIAPDELVDLAVPRPTWDGSALQCAVLSIDTFGNLRLNARADDIEKWQLDEGAMVEIAIAGRTLIIPFVHSFGLVEKGAMALLVDAYAYLMLAINRGHIAAVLGVTEDAPTTMRPL